jgi:hypothetical protein
MPLLIVLVSQITSLWTLLWSFTLMFVPQMVFLLCRYYYLVGSLVYLGITCPYISYVVHILSQFMSTPTGVHYNHLLCVLRYLCGTINRHLFFFSCSSLQLHAYSNVLDFSASTSPSCIEDGDCILSLKSGVSTIPKMPKGSACGSLGGSTPWSSAPLHF